MDIFLLIIGFLFALLGIIGSILPVLPGPLASWGGLLLLYFTKAVPIDWTILGITLGVAILVSVIDYVLPVLGTKKFGGSNYGVKGSLIGLIFGIFFGPLGIIVGPFLGAFIGELIKDPKDSKKALKAAVGSFIGFLSSTLLKLAVCLVFAGMYISIFWEHKDAFFGISS
ncbi:MAG: DUF456 domain-containing protein [Gelidibacter sp.]|nr:DUF456 domain-containing protein [Gelidibacter sp.]